MINPRRGPRYQNDNGRYGEMLQPMRSMLTTTLSIHMFGTGTAKPRRQAARHWPGGRNDGTRRDHHEEQDMK
jgi:hypothetical protein